MSELTTLLLGVLGVFALALAVRLLVRNRDRIAFASVLVFIGVAACIAPYAFNISGDPSKKQLPMVFSGRKPGDWSRYWWHLGLRFRFVHRNE